MGRLVVAADGEAEGPQRWPVWFAPVGFLIGMGATMLFSVLLTTAYVQIGGDAGDLPPSLTILGTLVQDVVIVGTAVGLAWLAGACRPADFGLRHVRLTSGLGWTVGGGFAFYGLTALYVAAVGPLGEQDVTDTLGVDRGSAYVLAAAIVVIFAAPFAEELFFRGFLYRALRNRLSPLAATLIVAGVFGSLHYSGPDTLLLLPILALLGAIFCLLYERTGSLYPAIALHAVNNSIALAATVDSSVALPIAAASGSLVIGGCAVASALQRR